MERQQERADGRNCLRIFQKGFNYSQDGPGNRLVYHLQGCNLRCAWCANPEGMTWEPPLLVNGKLEERYCPHGAIADGQLDRNVCKTCAVRECLTIHRNSSMKCAASDVPLEAIVQEAVSCRPMFFDGGGVTFTGGEPTLQWEALRQLLPLLKANGIAVALETNGTHPRLPELFDYIDTLMMDCKQADSALHERHTGAPNATILQNLRAAASAGRHPQIRIPLIHGVNDTEQDAQQFLRFFQSLEGAFTVEILPYHEYGKDKWAQCGRPYAVENGFVRPADRQRLQTLLRDHGIAVIHT